MTTEKTTPSSTAVLSTTLLRAGSQKQHAALRHFYGQDEEKRDQRQGGEAYTPKTLRYLLSMLRNRTQAILYVYEDKNNFTFKHALHGLCLLSKALGRLAVCMVVDKEASQPTQVFFIFAQQCVVVKVSASATLTAVQETALKELQQEKVLQKVQQVQPLLSTPVEAKQSGVVFIEWLSKLLRRPLSALLEGFQKIEQASPDTHVGVENLDVKSSQFLKAFKVSSLAKFRRRHESLLMDVPEQAVSDGRATSEEAFVQQCYDTVPQRLLPRLHNFIKDSQPFITRSKQLRDLLWNEKENALIQEFKVLSQQLRGNDTSALLPASEIQSIKFLAEGAFGKVYEGLWSKTPVAIKLLKQDAQLGVQEEFKNEAAFMLQLKHPRIVQCYGLCLHPLQAVFELMRGGSLESQLRVNQLPKQPFLDWSIRKQMLLDIGESIHYLHTQHIVHGDLRAANFLVDENQHVKLGDFGLAKQRVGVMTVAFANTHDLGKLPWLSPELLSKEGERTLASDVYSFGMVMWELVTGGEPFGAKKGLTQEMLIQIIQKGEVLNHHTLPADTPAWVAAIFQACLKSNPAERPLMSEILEVLFLAIDPARYVQLYDTKTRVASPWLQAMLSSLQNVPEVVAVLNSVQEGVHDSDSENEGVLDSDEETASVSSTMSSRESISNVSAGVTTPSPSHASTRSSGAASSTPISTTTRTASPSATSSTKIGTSSPLLARTGTSVESGVIPHALIQVDVTKKLGSGGFGVVYRGKYRGQEVAVKELLVQEFSPKAQQEFEWESQTMLQLRDPSVVHLYGVTNEKPYRMVLEFCELGALDRYLQKRPVSEVSWELRLHLSTGIASGLHYLHTYNPIIIHGDLKSLNVLLTGNPDRPKVKIGDFGMALLKTETQSKSTRTGSEGLTVSWAAPELFSLKGKRTIASDMYAFGMTLWEIASHSYPYANCSDPMIIRTSVMSGEREDVPEETPELFAEVMTACWSQDPKGRPSAEQALAKLQSYESSVGAQLEEESQVRPIDAHSLSGGGVSSAKSSSSSPSISPVASMSTKNASAHSRKGSRLQRKIKSKAVYFKRQKMAIKVSSQPIKSYWMRV